MTTNALADLDGDAPTAKRAQYEAFELDLEAPSLLRVTNGSYGDDEKHEHTYRVNIENGVPTTCECPSNTYQDGACKHHVAVAIRKPVLEAATVDGSQDRVATDGGELVVASDEGAVLEIKGGTGEGSAVSLPCAIFGHPLRKMLHKASEADASRQSHPTPFSGAETGHNH
ncbi:SWIM zinc finger family protein [Saliphagus infecundisoli]|uniref:SWIM zinc finger family protein n=1 Tax=Saliphagus infecundisoli TaxID=1849069 RepID=A0ABD5QCH8_9EURY|nr:SWIM zinc finger family protein [Saliphagus infecundisoli]